MTITSAGFAFFVAFVFLVYLVCPRRYRWIVLLLGSIGFYACAGLQFLPFIFVTSFTVWFGARKIGLIWATQEAALSSGNFSSEEKKARKAADKRHAKWILLAVLLINIGYLVFEKTLNYLDSQIAGLTLADKLIIPLGISYYTFSTVGYLLDVYWKRYAYEKNYTRFALYTIYFPHIVQGPISRYNRLGAELKGDLIVTYENVTMGLQLVLWGCFKKLVIADRVALYTSKVFANANQDGMLYLVGLFFDVIQIYTDFSGYMDIMLGISQMFGIELEHNFDRPFFSRTVPEFWRRWHMTLGGWFKDYVYYPITVSKTDKKLNKWLRAHVPGFLSQVLMTAVPVMITWVLTGLWHGTGVGYLAWGLYYGTLITFSVALADKPARFSRKLGLNTECFSYRLFQMTRMFCIFAGGRLLTKMSSFPDSLRILKRILTNSHLLTLFDGTLFEFGLNEFNFVIALVGIGILWAVSMLQERGSMREWLARQNIVFRWTILLLGIVAVLIYGIYGDEYSTAGFAYQQF